jgi:hypothetical protein
MTPQELIQVKYTGSISVLRDYVNISAQTIGILIVGILFWRILISYQNKKKQKQI